LLTKTQPSRGLGFPEFDRSYNSVRVYCYGRLSYFRSYVEPE